MAKSPARLTGRTASGVNGRPRPLAAEIESARSVSDTGLLASVAADVAPGNHHDWHIRQKPSASGRMQYVERIHKNNRLETTVAKCRLQLCEDTGDLISPDFRTQANGECGNCIVLPEPCVASALLCWPSQRAMAKCAIRLKVSLWFLLRGFAGGTMRHPTLTHRWFLDRVRVRRFVHEGRWECRQRLGERRRSSRVYGRVEGIGDAVFNTCCEALGHDVGWNNERAQPGCRHAARCARGDRPWHCSTRLQFAGKIRQFSISASLSPA